jgi:tetratricopeptide (TPR) repeat protein
MSEPSSSTPERGAVLAEAEALVERRRNAQARSVIARGLQHYPDDTELQYLAAFVDYVEDDNDAAMRGVHQVLVREPTHYGARRVLAWIHTERKEYPQAEQIWISLLREYPEDPDSYAFYAKLMLTTLNVEKAGQLAREGLRHAPEHASCLYVATLVDLVEGHGNAENLQTLLREHPENVQSSFSLVAALSARGDNRAALRIAQELLRNQPDSQDIVDLVRELRMQSHWTMLPLYPMQRWGWGGAIAVTIAGIVGVRALNNSMPGPLTATLTWVWLGYVVYSWIWPSILRKMLG